MEPTEDQISQVIDFAGLDRLADRDMVIQALRNNGGNSEAVVMSYFDNPDSFRQRFTMQWNDSMFGADRNGENDNTAGSSFHVEEPKPNPSFFIESMDNSLLEDDAIVTPPPDRYSLGAPSRPPSRSNVKSPLGRMIDMAASDVPRFSGQADQDLSQDIERALRESAQEAGIAAPGQESGILENCTSTPHFGPATRTQYDNDDWAIVRHAATYSRASNVLPASDRQRKVDAPAFLVQHPNTVGSHKLGGVLTILHEIPLARNALLRCGEPGEAYGFDSEWWQGKSITPVHPDHVQIPGSDSESRQGEDATPGFEAEIHRLMAFLDSTERSYGSSSILTNMIPDPAMGVEKQFYEHLGQRHGENLYPLTQIASLTLLHDSGSGDEPGDSDARFGLLEIEHLKGDYNHIKTLYEALDHLMWSDVLSWNEISDESKMAVFKDMGEVLALKFGGEGPEDSLDIPAEFYPERYLITRKREAGRIQKAWCETKLALMRIAREEKEVREWRDDFNQLSFDKKAKMEQAVEQWKVFEKYLQSAGKFAGMQQSGYDTNRFPDYHDAPGCPSEIQQQSADKVGDVLKLVERVLADVDKALEGLDAELVRLKGKQRSLGRLLTDPDKPGRPKPMTCKKYLLRGVATEGDVIYVCRRQQTDSVELGDSPSKQDQWWRLAYVLGEEHPVKAEKIEIERVMRDVWQETKTPLIIYATEDALNIPNDPLSLPLERFVKADNKTFRNELNTERTNKQENSPREYQFLDPISPSKRKHRSSSPDSLDTNHASLGSDIDNAFDNSFEDQAASFSIHGRNYEPHVVTTDDLPEFADVGRGDETRLEFVSKPIYHEVAPGPPQEMEQLPPLQPPSAASVTGHSEESLKVKADSVGDVDMPTLEKES